MRQGDAGCVEAIGEQTFPTLHMLNGTQRNRSSQGDVPRWGKWIVDLLTG